MSNEIVLYLVLRVKKKDDTHSKGVQMRAQH